MCQGQCRQSCCAVNHCKEKRTSYRIEKRQDRDRQKGSQIGQYVQTYGQTDRQTDGRRFKTCLISSYLAVDCIDTK